MKCLISFLLVFALTTNYVSAQQKIIDSLQIQLKNSEADTNRVQLLAALTRLYYQFKPDTALILGQQGYELAQKLNYPRGEALLLNRIASAYATVGDYAKCLQLFLKALKISEDMHDDKGIARCNNNLGDTYMVQEDFPKALPYFMRVKEMQKNFNDDYFQSITFLNIGECYLHLNKSDSALFYLKGNYQLVKNKKFEDLYGDFERDLGEVEMAKQHFDSALVYFQKSVASCDAVDDKQHLSLSYQSIARLYQKTNQQDSAIYYAQKALNTAQFGSYNQGILNASKMLSVFYENKNNIPEAFRYYKIATAAKDSLFSQDKVKQLLAISFEEKQHQQDIETAKANYRNHIKLYVLGGILFVFLLIATILFRNNRQKQKANSLLKEQKQEIQNTLTELKSTQAQLIQSEKMASLGELTAGIAHEIQNPLNFVNNFSEVSIELAEELKDEINKISQPVNGKHNIATIVDDLVQNQQKINYHGKRADSIVKGMLQHSRTSSGEKELTDINALADEYLRLSYHGLRAKDKIFNAAIETDFDADLSSVDGKINIIPHDIGRVLLNLYNNAFYSVTEKNKQQPENYEPTVSVSTKKINSKIEIRVKDNGMGIAQKIVDKMFQPFFTTKPTGQGTGLGLSLSYDIITKGHGGELKVETKEGEYAEFIIILPV